MKDFILFYPDKHEQHAEPGHPERPERITAIRNALEQNGAWNPNILIPPQAIPENILHAIHAPAYLAQLKAASEGGGRIDMDTYITQQSWQLALNAAGGAAAIAQAVWEREARRGFALCRPPGHHATPNQAMGFCMINNIAVAAESLLQICGAKKLAIIDVDLHHGNGTQDIFWQRGDVFFFSIHQMPLYPGTGYLDETGANAGQNTTANIPLPPYSGDEARAAALEQIILPLLEGYQPEMLLISLGLDAHWRDPLGHQLVTVSGYGETIKTLADWADQNCQGRIAMFLEGGYDLEAGAASAAAATQALIGNPWQDPLGPAPHAEDPRWQEIIEYSKNLWQL